MSDLLLITKLKKTEFLMFVFPLEYCVLSEVHNKPAFQIFDSQDKKLNFYCDSLKQKEKWVKKLNKFIYKARQEFVVPNLK